MENLLIKTKDVLYRHQLAIVFIVISILVRLIFWLYTGRVWEDALITLAPTRNVWLGNGLTHHISELRVHSFTSPISMLIPLIGNVINQGLFLLKLSSIIAGAMAIYYAYRIGRAFNFHWTAQLFLLSYLSTDQLQIFFGMAGMETQIATAVFLAAIYYAFTEKWKLLGFIAGLGMLTRPEFASCVFVLGIFMLIWHPKKIYLVIPGFLCIVVPWYLFTYFYYGSIIPNTIIAKTVNGQVGPFQAPLAYIWRYFKDSWQSIAPFREWFFTSNIPIPTFFIKLSVFIVLVLFVFGVIKALITREWRLLAIATIVGIFVFYRTASVVSIYYMWYLPPFMALLFITAAFGLSAIGQKFSIIAAVIAWFVAIMYSIHIPFSFIVEKQVQKKIECGVRFKTGYVLNSIMGPSDTVVLEPLGYIGYGAFNKTTYDFPGLSSKIVVHKISQMMNVGLIGVVDLVPALLPSFIVLRPREVAQLQYMYPDMINNYTPVARIKADNDTILAKWGYSESNDGSDGDFIILRRISPSTEISTPEYPDISKIEEADIYGVCKNAWN